MRNVRVIAAILLRGDLETKMSTERSFLIQRLGSASATSISSTSSNEVDMKLITHECSVANAGARVCRVMNSTELRLASCVIR